MVWTGSGTHEDPHRLRDHDSVAIGQAGFAEMITGYFAIMDPRLWRLLVTGSLRLFLACTAPVVIQAPILVAVAGVLVALLVPAPAPLPPFTRPSVRADARDRHPAPPAE